MSDKELRICPTCDTASQTQHCPYIGCPWSRSVRKAKEINEWMVTYYTGSVHSRKDNSHAEQVITEALQAERDDMRERAAKVVEAHKRLGVRSSFLEVVAQAIQNLK